MKPYLLWPTPCLNSACRAIKTRKQGLLKARLRNSDNDSIGGSSVGVILSICKVYNNLSFSKNISAFSVNKLQGNFRACLKAVVVRGVIDSIDTTFTLESIPSTELSFPQRTSFSPTPQNPSSRTALFRVIYL